MPVEIEATQWFENGDHPDDDCDIIEPAKDSTEQFEPFFSEGKVVRNYRNPTVDGQSQCNRCGDFMDNHGWIETLDQIVCPGTWIITDEKGKISTCKPEIFEETYVEA
jgi:hypothetical protein